MFALVKRDLKILFYNRSWLLAISFFFSSSLIFSFAIGSNPVLLQLVAPAIIWVNFLLSILLGLNHLLEEDYKLGSLDILLTANQNISALQVVIAKIISYLIAYISPLLLSAPILAIFLNITPWQLASLMITILISSPALTSIGLLSSCLTLNLANNTTLKTLIFFPLATPIIIFAVETSKLKLEALATSASFYFLISISATIMLIIPYLAAISLKAMIKQ